MKLETQAMLIGTESYVSQKTGETSAVLLLVQPGTTESVRLFSKDLNLLDCPPMSVYDCVLDYSETKTGSYLRLSSMTPVALNYGKPADGTPVTLGAPPEEAPPVDVKQAPKANGK